MRSTLTRFRYRFGPPVRAAALLMVLLGHLAFMSSPLHAQVLDEAADAIPMASSASPVLDGGIVGAHLQPSQDEHARNCGIQWTTSSQERSVASFVAAPRLSSPPMQDSLAQEICPVARALGPPLAGDSQALLQVFRL